MAGPGTIRLDSLPALSLLPSQVPGEACRLGRGPVGPQKQLWQCPALPGTLPGLGSLLGREGIRALDRGGDRAAKKV